MKGKFLVVGSHSAHPGNAADWCREEAGNMLQLEGQNWGHADGSGRRTSATWLSFPTNSSPKGEAGKDKQIYSEADPGIFQSSLQGAEVLFKAKHHI